MYAILKVKFVEYIQITIVDSKFNKCCYYMKTTKHTTCIVNSIVWSCSCFINPKTESVDLVSSAELSPYFDIHKEMHTPNILYTH